MDTVLQAFLKDVEQYLAATGMGPSALGKAALGDGHVVARMRAGKAITSRIMSQLRRFMADNPAPRPEGVNNSPEAMTEGADAA